MNASMIEIAVAAALRAGMTGVERAQDDDEKIELFDGIVEVLSPIERIAEDERTGDTVLIAKNGSRFVLSIVQTHAAGGARR